MTEPLDYEAHPPHPRPLLKVALIIAACLIVPVLCVGVLSLGIGMLFLGWEGTGQLVIAGGSVTAACVVMLRMLRWWYTVAVRCEPRDASVTEHASERHRT